MNEHAPSAHCGNRLFEWTAAFALLAIGVQLYIFPDAINASRFHPILDIVTTSVMRDICLAVGCVRIFALYCHGSLAVGSFRTCALLRSFCALASMAVWLQMGMALYTQSQISNVAPSIGMSVYWTLSGAELYSTLRAALDVYRR